MRKEELTIFADCCDCDLFLYPQRLVVLRHSPINHQPTSIILCVHSPALHSSIANILLPCCASVFVVLDCSMFSPIYLLMIDALASIKCYPDGFVHINYFIYNIYLFIHLSLRTGFLCFDMFFSCICLGERSSKNTSKSLIVSFLMIYLSIFGHILPYLEFWAYFTYFANFEHISPFFRLFW
jgi:hypothetical protein